MNKVMKKSLLLVLTSVAMLSGLNAQAGNSTQGQFCSWGCNTVAGVEICRNRCHSECNAGGFCTKTSYHGTCVHLDGASDCS